MENVYIVLKQIHSGENDVPNFIRIAKFYRRYYKKRFGLFFPGHSVAASILHDQLKQWKQLLHTYELVVVDWTVTYRPLDTPRTHVGCIDLQFDTRVVTSIFVFLCTVLSFCKLGPFECYLVTKTQLIATVMIYYYYSVHFRFAVLSIVGVEFGPVLVLFFFHFFGLGCTFRGKISTRSSTVFGKLRLGFVLALRLVLRLELELGLS